MYPNVYDTLINLIGKTVAHICAAVFSIVPQAPPFQLKNRMTKGRQIPKNKNPGDSYELPGFYLNYVFTCVMNYFIASSTATAQATVAPTIGLLPMPMRPIIST